MESKIQYETLTKKLSDMKKDSITIGMAVCYVPKHHTSHAPIADNQLGIVTSMNDKFVFVRYKHSNTSQATNAEDLYSIDQRPDLQERLGLEVKPINRVCELFLEEKKMLSDKNTIL